MGGAGAEDSGDAVREDLEELLARRALTEDAARPEAVAAPPRRRRRGPRARTSPTSSTRAPSSSTARFAIAAQRGRREVEELIERTPADGLIAGTARINGELFGAERAACAVLSYDYTVLAGTQGALGHRKKDRLFELIERMRLPTVLFAEGGGGRPGDTDYPVVSALDTRAFALWARLSGLVPRIAIVAGRCFAGNAVLAGCCGPDRRHRGRLARDGRAGDDRGRRARRVRPRARSGRSTSRRRTASSTSWSPTRPRRSPRRSACSATSRAAADWHGARPGAAARRRPREPPPRLRRRAGRSTTLADDGSVHLPARALRAGDGDRAGADRGPAGRRDRQQPAAHGRRDHQRRRRQGGALPAALRRLRHARALARRHARASWSGRTPRRPALVRHALAAARRRRRTCGCRWSR